ncbi:MAG TPA: UDP-N-acetylmuramoyl-L-alanyl-D-glutamate--2,6-diaminopimelate ligase, partial [Actinomycetota bacterium]|nr:UDP-N-acetylmuramoyl-L-alanyl-D-glutamate--2,6-diaminopimelate ligase [Actinomycetota bacterium]
MGSQVRPLTLGAIASSLASLVVDRSGETSVTVLRPAYDSRAVEPGDLFFCISGLVADGHAFADDAVAAGAVALCTTRRLDKGLPELVVADTRRALALVSAEMMGRPSDDLLTIGITGTNGKTTTAFMIEAILAAAGRSPGLIGTIETHVGGERRPGVRTTPESLDLQMLLREMVDKGADSVAMEVTSHALVLQRVEGIRFRVAVFTNLSQDHLDFHSNMEDYFEAKRSLFTSERAQAGVVNVDDVYGRKLLENAAIPCIGYGMSEDAEVRASDVELDPSGTRFRLIAGGEDVLVATTLVGGFNVYNCLGAAAACLQAGIDLVAVARGVSGLNAVPGRFEAVDSGQPFTVAVDYAHTPDSLDNVLRAAREMVARTGGKVLCVFGAGGDRDRAKRPLMGAVAARGADVVIVTSDNPRSEEPASIVSQIVEGVIAESPEGPDEVLVDRRAAIETAIGMALAGDVVVIAGKGHETG